MLNSSSANFRLAIKTAIAGCLAMYLASLFRMPQPYWAAISAMIVMQTNLGAAVKQSWIRFAATAVGAAVTIPFMAFPGRICWSSAWPCLSPSFCARFCTLRTDYASPPSPSPSSCSSRTPDVLGCPRSTASWKFRSEFLSPWLVAEFVLPSTALESLRQALAEKLLQLDTFLSALLLRFRGENVVDVEALRASLETLGRQNTDFYAHGRYEPARWSARRITLVKLLQHEERMSQAVETLDAACGGPFCGGIDLRGTGVQ